MMRLFCLLIFLTAGCTIPQDIDKERSYLIVMGTLKNRDFQADDDWTITTGRVSADLYVTRVLSGRTPSRLVKIHYMAHMYRPEKIETRFRLRRSDTGVYLVCGEKGGIGYICP
jgi:hypothetical protein